MESPYREPAAPETAPMRGEPPHFAALLAALALATIASDVSHGGPLGPGTLAAAAMAYLGVSEVLARRAARRTSGRGGTSADRDRP